MNVLLGRTGMTRVLFLCLMAIATNAVLIQTIVDENSMLKNLVRVGVLGVAAFAMIMHNSKLPIGYLLVIMFSVVLLVGRQNTDQLSIVFIFILVPALFAVRERSLGKIVAVSAVGSLVLIFALLAAGLTHNEINEFRGRSTFGTNGVPFFYNVVYGALTMALVYAHKYRLKLRLIWTVGAVALATHLFNLTDARGGYYAFLVFVGLLYTMPLLARIPPLRLVAKVLPVIFLVVAFYIASMWDNGAANLLLSNRPALYQRFIEGLTEWDYLLSSTVKALNTSTTIVDNSYLHLLVGGGLIICTVFIVIFAQAVTKLFRMGKFVDAAFLIATCIYFNSESIMFRIENIFVIYFWYLVIRYSRPLIRDRGVSRLEGLKHQVKIPAVPPMKDGSKKRPATKQRLPAWHQSQATHSRVPEWQRKATHSAKPRRADLPVWAGKLPDPAQPDGRPDAATTSRPGATD